MKKVAFLFAVSMLLCSCRVIKQVGFALKGDRMDKKTEKVYHHGRKIPFLLNENAIFIPCEINGDAHLICYDIQIGGFLHENVPGNDTFPKCKKSIKLRMKTDENQRIVYKIGLKYYDVESDFFNFENFVGIVTSQSNDTTFSKSASENTASQFFIGGDAFPNGDVAMLLSFSDTTITLFDSFNVYDTTGFSSVESSNPCTGTTVRLKVDSIEYDFLLDTGSTGFLTLPQREKDMSEERDDAEVVVDTPIIQQPNTIIISDLKPITGNILYSEKARQPVMGMEFIAHFDWIIDVNRDKIYVKQIS